MSARIGLIWPQTGGLWTAGNLYFENLVESVSLAGHMTDLCVVESEGGSFSARPRPGVRVATYRPSGEPAGRAGILARMVRRQLGLPDRAVARAVSDAGIGVAFGDVDPAVRFPVPWVGWIPDFQHLHYPDFFSAEELAARDRIYGRLAQRASLVLLSSHDALRDFQAFAPGQAGKGRVASFVSLFPDDYLTADAGAVAAQYGIEGRFVVVPNQWWQHKDHETALRAAALMRDRGVACTWVFTGALADYRNDRHISRLLQMIAAEGIRDRVVILGALPRRDQVQLMRAAQCIVQPSLFEGWSTVVEDAKTLGQRLVVSDLAVHREQQPGAALFFEPGSAQDLADKVSQMLDGRIERVPEEAAAAAAAERAAAFGEVFVGICGEAATGRRDA